MNEAKLMLSPEELQLMQNAGWILTKNKVIHKVCELFGILAEEMKPQWEQSSLHGLYKINRAKISKGENLKGLPYVVLDYPGHFEKENIFSIRSLFWWGNYFSITLHLKGDSKSRVMNSLMRELPLLAKKDFQIFIGDDEWIQDLNEKYFILISKVEKPLIGRIFETHSFLKISTRIEIQEMDQVRKQLLKHFAVLLECLAH
ncbi:MAG: hypothetical protein ACHQET_01830 [Chitinophagales bacterium]